MALPIKTMLSLTVMSEIRILLMQKFHDLDPAKLKVLSMNLSVEKTYILWLMSAIIV